MTLPVCAQSSLIGNVLVLSLRPRQDEGRVEAIDYTVDGSVDGLTRSQRTEQNAQTIAEGAIKKIIDAALERIQRRTLRSSQAWIERERAGVVSAWQNDLIELEVTNARLEILHPSGGVRLCRLSKSRVGHGDQGKDKADENQNATKSFHLLIPFSKATKK
jgi:hypothetical protein